MLWNDPEYRISMGFKDDHVILLGSLYTKVLSIMTTMRSRFLVYPPALVVTDSEPTPFIGNDISRFRCGEYNVKAMELDDGFITLIESEIWLKTNHIHGLLAAIYDAAGKLDTIAAYAVIIQIIMHEYFHHIASHERYTRYLDARYDRLNRKYMNLDDNVSVAEKEFLDYIHSETTDDQEEMMANYNVMRYYYLVMTEFLRRNYPSIMADNAPKVVYQRAMKNLDLIYDYFTAVSIERSPKTFLDPKRVGWKRQVRIPNKSSEEAFDALSQLEYAAAPMNIVLIDA